LGVIARLDRAIQKPLGLRWGHSIDSDGYWMPRFRGA